MPLILNGKGVSGVCVSGRAHLLKRDEVEIFERRIEPSQLEAEVARFEAALAVAQESLASIRAQLGQELKEDIGQDVMAIVDTHVHMLQDPEIREVPAARIRESGRNAEWAVEQQRIRIRHQFDSFDDAYLAARGEDIDFVFRLVLRSFATGDSSLPKVGRGHLILVAGEFSPEDCMLFRRQGVVGIISEAGGAMTHSSIVARALGIVAIVRVVGARQLLREGEPLIIDCERDTVIVNPGFRQWRHYRRCREANLARLREFRHLAAEETQTSCGHKISLLVNIDTANDLLALEGARHDGVGLYRTEYLFSDQQIPDEEAHFLAYRRTQTLLGEAPMTIRTADLGAEKHFGMDVVPVGAVNPALGVRGIRLSFKRPDLFMPQLRAILRVSAFGRVKMLLPMVTSVAELREIRRILAGVQSELRAEGLKFDENLEVGAMIEVPAAAVAVDQLAGEVDFLSIGSNDLVQYTLAIDRSENELEELYDSHHPAVLALIKRVVDAGARRDRDVTLCGEMAQYPATLPLLLGMGLTSLSVPPNAIFSVRAALAQICLADARREYAALESGNLLADVAL